MKLTRRGERVLAFYIFLTMTLFAGALGFGAQFLLTHKQVIQQETCHNTPDGWACDWEWERK
jgi:hypothetical protein